MVKKRKNGMNNIANNSLSKKLGIIILMRMKNHKECGKGKKKGIT